MKNFKITQLVVFVSLAFICLGFSSDRGFTKILESPNGDCFIYHYTSSSPANTLRAYQNTTSCCGSIVSVTTCLTGGTQPTCEGSACFNPQNQ